VVQVSSWSVWLVFEIFDIIWSEGLSVAVAVVAAVAGRPARG